ncbi:MAG: LacI family DNA-binding transcriptional regulator [Clostridiales bacterium]|nr:LacI family DNA-binding transcriptional regulator [Clostridiales bacterium]
MATIQDVARHAQVGAATVSRVLSGNGYVKEETRQRVLKSIDELDYTPNEMARHLFFRKTGIVAVIVPELSHPFFSELVNGIEVALCAAGYQTMICNTFYEENYELRYLDMLKRQVVDGIIFAAHTSLGVERYQNIHRPIVALDRYLGDSIPCLAADHQQGGRLAAEELIRAGCRNVVQFGGADETAPSTPFGGEHGWVSTPSVTRHTVFAQVMQEHGVTCHSRSDQWVNADFQQYRVAADAMFREIPDVDGVFAADPFALAVLQAAQERGLRIPEDLKLVSYDGTQITKLVYPSVTTIVQPIERLAQEAVGMMLDLIQGKELAAQNVTLPVTLRRGASTAV